LVQVKKQAHIIDKDTSVYSQHCAVVHCRQPPPEPSRLVIYPLGGCTKVWSNRHFTFVPVATQTGSSESVDIVSEKTALEGSTAVPYRSDEEKAKDEKERMDKVKEFYMKEDFKSAVLPLELIPKLETNRQEEAEILFEGEKRRCLDYCKSCIQLGSSERVYYFDMKKWHPIQEDAPPLVTTKTSSQSPPRSNGKRHRTSSTTLKTSRHDRANERSSSRSRSREIPRGRKDFRCGSRSISRRRSKSRERSSRRRTSDHSSRKRTRDSLKSKDNKKKIDKKKSKRDKYRKGDKSSASRRSRRSDSSSSRSGSSESLTH